MNISPISSQIYKPLINNSKENNKTSFKSTLPNISKVKSLYEKGSSIPFKGTLIQRYMNENEYFLYNKFLNHHIKSAEEVNPELVEQYFNALGIPCNIKMGTEKTRKVIAYCCYNAAEIFRQINMPLPVRIDMEENSNNSNPNLKTIASCYYGPNYQRGFPIRTVTFNVGYDWDHHMENSYTDNNNKFHTSGHFLQTFLHEFGHNVHFDKLYSKFGCPYPNQGYNYNPNMMNIMNILNMKIYNNDGSINYNNPYISSTVRGLMKQSSGYGSSLLPELFAEEFAKALLICMGPRDLKLYKNPFPIITSTPELDQVIHETWEGLIADGKGYI